MHTPVGLHSGGEIELTLWKGSGGGERLDGKTDRVWWEVPEVEGTGSDSKARELRDEEDFVCRGISEVEGADSRCWKIVKVTTFSSSSCSTTISWNSFAGAKSSAEIYVEQSRLL